MKPTLAVWMPNYNHSQYIGRAIEAIASQTRLPDEFYIIDDASTDNSLEVIANYQQKYPWIHLIRNIVNQGAIATLQRGVTETSTDYVLMTAADDFTLPHFFADAMKLAEQYPQAGIIFGNMTVEDDQGKYMYEGRPTSVRTAGYLSSVDYLNKYLRKEPPNQSLSAATIYNRKELEHIGGFRSELGPWCDTFALQALALKNGAAYTGRAGAVWTIHSTSLSQKNTRRPQHMLSAISHAAYLMHLPEFKSYWPAEYVRSWLWKYRAVLWLQWSLSFLPVSWLQSLQSSSNMRFMYHKIMDYAGRLWHSDR